MSFAQPFDCEEPLGLRPETDLGAYTEERPKLCIEAWLLVPQPEGLPHLLMLERGSDHGGFWQGVSGRAEATDRSLADTVRREVREETGYRADEVVDIGPFSTFRGFVSGSWFRKRVFAVWLAHDVTAAATILSEEHVHARVVDFDTARELVQWPANREALDRIEAWIRDGKDPRRD